VKPVQDRLRAALAGAARPFGLAVSGGSDSLALLHLVAQLGEGKLACATVNHGLRAEAKAECALVAEVCARLGLSHTELSWHWSGEGNLQAAARAGRYEALAHWARAQGLGSVLLGHTQDDVAETFLMRVARGSGVKGLARMRPSWRAHGMGFERPLLEVSRAELRQFLSQSGQVWAEDASNEDPRFERVRMRQAMGAMGLSGAQLAETAVRLADADEALEEMATGAAQRVAQLVGRNIVIEAQALAALPREISHRLMSAWTMWQGRSPYPARREALAGALARALAGKNSTVNGCALLAHKGQVVVAREARAGAQIPTNGTTWDGLSLLGPWPAGAQMGALGVRGLALAPEWRSFGLPRAALLGAPALWQGTRLFAAPCVGLRPEFSVKFSSEPPYLQA
jgi:tRNA(Ile)-lysidine synthase